MTTTTLTTPMSETVTRPRGVERLVAGRVTVSDIGVVSVVVVIAYSIR